MVATRTGDELIAVGDRAPDFALPSQSGERVRLSDLLGNRVVVLYFYPKDGSGGCTAEACGFRDAYEAFADADAEVIGISGDAPESHRRFAARHDLPFRLLSDTDGEVRKRYGVPKKFGLLPGRVTYIIDTHGIVRHIFFSQFDPAQHVTEALRVVRSLQEE